MASQVGYEARAQEERGLLYFVLCFEISMDGLTSKTPAFTKIANETGFISWPTLAIRETTVRPTAIVARSARQCEAYLLQLLYVSCWTGRWASE